LNEVNGILLKNGWMIAWIGWLIQNDINGNLTLGAEVFTQGDDSVNSHSFTMINAGGIYNLSKQFSVLFSAGHSIIGANHIIGYLSLYWTDP
jgi:hypothetical protein